jgi:integrase
MVATRSANGKPAAGPETLAEMADHVERVARSMAKNNTTIGYYRRVFRMAHGLGASERGDFNLRLIRLFDAEAKQRGIGAYTDLMSAMHTAFEILGIPWPSDAPPLPRPPVQGHRSERPSRLSAADVQAILDELRARAVTPMGRCVYAYACTLVFADIGVGEARRLRVEDFDREREWILVRSREATAKSLFPPRVRYDEKLGPILADWLPRTGCEYAFPNVSRTGPLDTNERRGRGSTPIIHLRAAAEAGAGIGDATFDDLRRYHVAHVRPSIPGIGARVPARPKKSELAIEVPVRYSCRELTVEEAVRILIFLRGRSAGYRGHRVLTIAALALLAGLGFGAIRRLRIVDVDLGRSMLRVRGRPPVLLTPEAAEILGRWLGRPDRLDSRLVFPDATRDGPWGIVPGPYNLRTILAREANEAGIEGHVGIRSFSRLWRRCGGRVELGEAWRSGEWPELILGAPRAVRRHGPARERREEPAALPDLATWDPPIPAIEIGPDGRVRVFDEDREPFKSKGQTRIIRALVDDFRRGGRGLTAEEIEEAARVRSPRQTLIEFRKDTVMRRAIRAEREDKKSPVRYSIAPR